MFHVPMTAWLGEWSLLACGLSLHAVLGGLLMLIRRRPVAWAGMESQKA